MSDVLTPAQRKYCMSRIRGKNTKPEIALRKALWHQGIRYRISNNLPGPPDIVFSTQGVVVFVDGCFWHMCTKHFSMPKNNRNFWRNKLEKNVTRDSEVNSILRKHGWKVIRLWEHEIENMDRCIARIKKALN